MHLKIEPFQKLKQKFIIAVMILGILLGTATSLMAEERPLGDIGLPDDYFDTVVTLAPQLRGFDQLEGALPSTFNWADQGMVTPAKDQGRCGGCWAFAATGTFESKMLIMGRRSYDLSEQ
jgi:C1A family cysteine protease